jgi:hypothetical protein
MAAFFLLRISDHMQYLERVRATLDGQDDFSGLPHDQCQLGQWLAEVERMAPLGDASSRLRALRELHERFHAESDHALELRDRPAQAQEHVTGLFRYSGQLVDLLFELDRLPEEVSSLLLPSGRARRRAAPRPRDPGTVS